MPDYKQIENQLLKSLSKDDKLHLNILQIKNVVEKIWGIDTPRIIQGFTDHGISHSLRIIFYLDKLFKANKGTPFTIREKYILLAGAYLHDIGMQCDVNSFPEIKDIATKLGAQFDITFSHHDANNYSLEEQTEIRKNHQYLSVAWIDYANNTGLTILGPTAKEIRFDLINQIMEVCKYHSKLPIEKCPEKIDISYSERLKLMSSLLRFADELDIDKDRVNIEVINNFTLEPKNRVYWWLHNYTKIDFTTNHLITITVSINPQDSKQYGSIIHDLYINNFIEKNSLITSILAENNIPIIINSQSKILPNENVDPIPIDIIKEIQSSQIKQSSNQILNEMVQYEDNTVSISEIKTEISIINKSSDSDSNDIQYDYEYKKELDHSKYLLESFQNEEALEFLENLKAQIWQTANPIAKFRLLTNIGTAKFNQRKETEAANYYIEALQYNPENEKAILNCALGYFLLGEKEKVRPLIEKVLKLNPLNPHAFSFLIQSIDEPLENLESMIPDSLKNDSEIAYAMSHQCRLQNNLFQEINWLEIALENDNDNPELKAALATTLILIIQNNHHSIYTKQLDDNQKNNLNRAIQLLNEAWDSISNTSLKKYRLEWLINRSVAKKFLGDIIGSSLDIEKVLEINPADISIKKYKAILAYENKDIETAENILKEILTIDQNPDIILLLAKYQSDQKRYKEAINLLIKSIESNISFDNREVNELLVYCYIRDNNYEQADVILHSLRNNYPTDILILLDSAQLAKLQENKDLALHYTKSAMNLLTNKSSFIEIVRTADTLNELEQTDEAIKLYEKITDITLDTNLTRKLLYCYYHHGEMGRALYICQNLTAKYGPNKAITEMESAIYEEIGDLQNAKKVCNEYLKIFSDDLEIALRKAVVSLHLKDINAIDQFLEKINDVSTFSLKQCILLAQLYAERNLHDKAIDLLYETRRKFYNDSEAHFAYISLFFQWENAITHLLTVDSIKENVAVCIQSETNKTEWYILENRDKIDFVRKEISINHPFSERLFNKKINEEVIIKENPISTEIGKIIEIKSKYIYALHESMESFEKLFPNTHNFYGIKIDTNNNGTLPKEIQTLLDQAAEQKELVLEIESKYRQGHLTVGLYANLIGINAIDAWRTVIGNSKLGLKCCEGNRQENRLAIYILQKKPKLIIDLISLMTLHGLGLQNVTTRIFGKFGIAQSTIDLLQYTVLEHKGIKSRGFMTINKEGEEFVKNNISADQIKNNIEYFQILLNWIYENCDILPCTEALNINREFKKQLSEPLGQPFIDTMLIAKEPGYILFSDDQNLRIFAKNQFNIDGVWTQVVLSFCKSCNELNKNDYNQAIVKLICSNYYNIPVDDGVLIEAARQANWFPKEPFISVLNILSENSLEIKSVLNVTCNFLYELWKTPILTQQRDILIFSVFDKITENRNRDQIFSELSSLINNKFLLLPFAEEQITSLIKIWKRIHVT